MGTLETEKRDIQKFVPKYKMGIKVLGYAQLYNIFPTYQNLLGKIEVHRQEIFKLNGINTVMKERYQYNLMYDNVFSILGKRGTGKTSAVFSLKNMFEMNHTMHVNDIVLPIIMPEIIPENGNILGWIIALFGDVVDEIETSIKNQTNHREENEFFRNCHFVENNPLRKSLKEIKELCFSQKYNPTNELSFYEAVGNAAQQAQNSYSLAKSITAFWSELMNAIIKSTGQSIDGDFNKLPLIYIIFDDVDLSPEKVENLMSIITKYLSHPNVIVLITADEDLFLEVIENSIDKRIGRVKKDVKQLMERFMESYLYYNSLSEGTHVTGSADQTSDTARLYLSKVLPPSSRYYLTLYHDYDKKKSFQIYEGKSIESELCRRINQLLGKEDNSKENFLYYNNQSFIGFYLEYFGITARQISNAFFIIEDLMKDQERIHNEYKTDGNISACQYKIYYQIRHFLYSSIAANNHIADTVSDVGELVDSLLLLEYNKWFIFINYPYLNYRFHEISLHKDDETEVKGYAAQTIALYSLLFFTENILVAVDQLVQMPSPRTKFHGINEFRDFINNSVFSGEPYIRAFDDGTYFLYHYEHLLRDALGFYHKNMYSAEYVNKYLYCFSDRESTVVSAHDIIQMYIEDEKWLLKIAGMLFLSYSKVFLIDTKLIQKYEISRVATSNYDNYVSKQFTWFIQDYFKNIDIFNIETNSLDKILRQSGGKESEITEQKVKQDMYNLITQYFTGSGAEYISLTELSSSLHPIISKEYKTNIMIHAFTKFDRYYFGVDNISSEEKLENIIIDIKSEIIEIKASLTDIMINNTEQIVEALNQLVELKNGLFKSRIDRFIKGLKDEPGVGILYDVSFLQLLRDINDFIIKSKKRADSMMGEFSDKYVRAFNNIVSNIDYAVKIPNRFEDIDNVINLMMDVIFLRDMPPLYFGSQIQNADQMESTNLTSIHLATTLDGNKEHYYYQLYKRIKWLINRTKDFSPEDETEIIKKAAYLREEATIAIQDAREEYLNDNWKG